METPKQSFKSFYKMYFSGIVRFAVYYLEDEHEGEDIAQETFLKIYEKWDVTNSEEQMRSYLYITARNLCFDKLRHQNVAEEYSQQIIAEKEIKNEEEESFLSEVTYQEVFRQLYNAISELPPQTQRIILLGLKGKSNIEISEELNISVNTVKTLKRNAYKSLRNNVDKSLISENVFSMLLMFISI